MYAKIKNYEHGAVYKLWPWLKNESLLGKLNAMTNKVWHFSEPWFILANNPVNQVRLSVWVEDKVIEAENFIVSKIPMMMAFPLSVLATNRILDTPISRSGTANSFRPKHLVQDLLALVRIRGHRTLFAGLVPTMIFYYYSEKRKETASKP